MARILPDWLRAYMEYSAYTEAPEIFHFWTGVFTIAGALRKKIYIDQEAFIWTPNFYIVFVGPPGIVTKSTTISRGVELLEEINGIKFGPDSITWQELICAFAESTEMVQMPDGLFHSMSCLNFASSELGSLLDPHDRRMINVLTDLWDGQDRVWRKATKTQGSDTAANPWINLIACTTPAWMADELPKTLIGGGLTSRIIFVYAEKKRALIAYPKNRTPKSALALREPLIRDLEAISMLKGEYVISPEATEYGEQWYEDHYEHPPKLLTGDPQFGGYLSRKQGHIHKLAMVIAASKRDELCITREDLMAATRILDATEGALPMVFKAINASNLQENASKVIGTVKAHGKMPKATLYRLFMHMMPLKEFDEALNAGITANLIRTEQSAATSMLFVVYVGEDGQKD